MNMRDKNKPAPTPQKPAPQPAKQAKPAPGTGGNVQPIHTPPQKKV